VNPRAILCFVALRLAALAPQLGAQTADALNPGANNSVFSVAIQVDGRILAAGSFSTVAGQARSGIARINADGTLDTTFNPAPGNSTPFIYSLAVETDAKILLGGAFTTLGGQNCTNLGRVNADGTRDASFAPGPNNLVQCIAAQADLSFVVGGAFTSLGGQLRKYIARLAVNGGLDTNFDPSADGSFYPNPPGVLCLAIQPDGKTIAGGTFSSLGGQSRELIGRVNADGGVDNGFNPGAVGGSAAAVRCLAVQPDGSILAGGLFTSLGGLACTNIGRLTPNGVLDPGFSPGADGAVYSIALRADGKILIGGAFTVLAGRPSNHIGQLNADGSLDTNFNASCNGVVYALALQPDGRILAGGAFTALGGQTRNHIGRLNNPEPATQSLSFDGATIRWLRAGSSPEVWRTSFEASTNGTSWAALGSGSRIAGGWQLSGLSLPADLVIRARGPVVNGQLGGSDWSAETISGPPAITSQPAGRTNNAATLATFNVSAVGGQPLSYQWLKDQVALNDGGKISGARTAALQVSNVFGINSGAYSVAITNISGAVTSQIAILSVTDPLITQQPSSQNMKAGFTVVFTASAAGTAPAYQWLKGALPLVDGGKISGARTSRLVITNLLGEDAGGYSVLVSNSFGSVTSLVANLSVTDPYIASSPASRWANQGDSLSFAATVVGTASVGYQWRKDGVSLSGQTTPALAFTNVQWSDRGSYALVASNSLGMATSSVAIVTVNLATADSFNPVGDFDVFALAVQRDGRILVGGEFNRLGGQLHTGLGRLNADGTLDTDFLPAVDDLVTSLAVQPDGRVLVGGLFTRLGVEPRANLGRLNGDGTVDTAFNAGTDNIVNSLVVQSDGKIVVGGQFVMLAGQPRRYLGRLNPDGTLDAGFSAETDYWVYSLALQPDGKILVGGWFNTLAGQPRNGIGRLNPDGTLDTAFVSSPNTVKCLALQADGRILTGGYGIQRLNGDGSADSTFNTPSIYSVSSLGVQANGKVVIGGFFSSIGALTRHNLARLNPDGTPDESFDPLIDNNGSEAQVSAVAGQKDGKVLVGGYFGTVAGQSRPFLGRVGGVDSATEHLSLDGSNITWTRAGSAPEVWRVTFEATTNGFNWIDLGAPTRVTGGWYLSGVTVAPQATIRARGFATGGLGNGSSWFIETLLAQVQPAVFVNNSNFGFRAGRFGFDFIGAPGASVVVEGSSDLVNWQPLSTNTLTTAPVYFSDLRPGYLPKQFYRARY
jgi:uncharacterized delta-60 repeat protein